MVDIYYNVTEKNVSLSCRLSGAGMTQWRERSTLSHQCGPGWIPARSYKWVEFVVVFRPRSSSLHKNQQFTFQLDQERKTARKRAKTNFLSFLNIVIAF